MHWWRGRDQARLIEVHAGSGQWTGPCPKCGRPRALTVKAGDSGGVVWNLPGCEGRHSRDDVYPILLTLVPHAPPPGRRHNPEAEALKGTIRDLVLNEKFIHSNPVKLAILEALGDSTDEALDALGITDTGNRRRTRKAKDLALSPAKTVTNDSRRRSKARAGSPGGSSPRATVSPAKTHLPATTVTNDSPQTVTNDSRPSMAKPPLTSTFLRLTDGGTLVSGPPGLDTDKNTDTVLDLALELVRTELGAEVISTEPRTSPLPVADVIEAWTAAEEGPCTRCGTRTCRYGDRGSPLCADCRSDAEVRTAGSPATRHPAAPHPPAGHRSAGTKPAPRRQHPGAGATPPQPATPASAATDPAG